MHTSMFVREALQLSALPTMKFEARKELPEEGGIYFAMRGDEVLYIGRAVNIKNRWASHHRTRQLEFMGCTHLAWLTVSERGLLHEIESALIAHYSPPINGTPIGGEWDGGCKPRIGPFTIRFSPDELASIQSFAKADGRTVSGLIRHVVLTHLREEVKKKETR